MVRNLFPTLALLAACSAEPQTPPPAAAGASVTYLGRVYPIEGTPWGWQIEADGERVARRAPTTDDCYWSLRNHLTSEARLADIP